MSSSLRPTLHSAIHPLQIPRPPGYYHERYKGKRTTKVYAVDIPYDVIYRYAEVFWGIYFPHQYRPIAPKDISAIKSTILGFAAENLYVAYPGLPRHRDKIRLLTRGEEFWWLFVFKDDSSEALLNAPLDPADVAGALEYLLLSDREPKWYDLGTRPLGRRGMRT
ncbi:hypothetical protein ACG7TL_002009 [Trametes sanguinea]